MSAEHTPTPWSVASKDRAIIREVPGMADGYDHYMVGVLSSHSVVSHEEAKANAAFIVEAVNNHDRLTAEVSALRKALEEYETALDEAEAIFGGEYADHYGPMFELAMKARDARRAALAPASGGEQKGA